MAAMNAYSFAEAAQRDGIAVSAEEVQRRVELYKAMYPGQEVGPQSVKSIVLAEKYLERKGMRPDGAEPDTASEGQVDPSRFATPAEAKLAKETERLHRFLAREETQREADKLDNLAQLLVSSEASLPPMRPQSELQVQGDPEECLAWSGRNCLIPLREYNAATAYYPMPTSMPLDSAKAIILKRYLSEKRLAVEANEQGFAHQAEALMTWVRGRKDDFRWMQATTAFGTPVRDMRLLEATYSKYYQRYFAAGEDITLAVIGSSDSAYLDSLHRVFQAWDRKRAADRKPGLPGPKEPPLPWSYFKESQVPKDLAALTDSLKVGQCAKPYRSPMGRFLVRLAKAVPTREVSLEEADMRLIYLATRDKFLEMDSVAEAQARRYYAANIARYTSPDTMALRAWLIPRPEPSLAVGPGRGGKMPALGDTTRFKPMEMSSLSLPTELRIALQEQVKRDSAHKFIGPLPDRYGRWYFQVRSRKPGRGVLPFRLARKDILDRMTAPPEDQGSGIASDEEMEAVGANLALAQALKQEQFRKQREERAGKRPPEDKAGLFGSNAASESGPAQTAEAVTARIRAEEANRRAEEARMLTEARVDLNRLFR